MLFIITLCDVSRENMFGPDFSTSKSEAVFTAVETLGPNIISRMKFRDDLKVQKPYLLPL